MNELLEFTRIYSILLEFTRILPELSEFYPNYQNFTQILPAIIAVAIIKTGIAARITKVSSHP